MPDRSPTSTSSARSPCGSCAARQGFCSAVARSTRRGTAGARRNLVDPAVMEIGEELAVARAPADRADRLRGGADGDIARLAGRVNGADPSAVS
ncbi:DUF1876 domain-containing protein [Actinomadura bangladeshensis]|uniref:DUF1876 domain-containing protein n=1 Tax=Actinomadura bangladeshensis TaxID=453573 RepID=A0A6L9QXM2_9ACTN|nr:dsRBD fold-containing protein [Actinomadura bangladeshensis]NEA29878.1 DUF1876 domain-containing protein [Actinomadura bangladeshensis]